MQPQPPLVLVVDDEPDLLKALKRALRGTFRVLAATGAAEAIALASGEKLDFILSDFSMGGENGVQLVERLRAAGQQAPAVILTAVPETEELTDALRRKLICQVLAKPWSPSALVAEISRILGGG